LTSPQRQLQNTKYVTLFCRHRSRDNKASTLWMTVDVKELNFTQRGFAEQFKKRFYFGNLCVKCYKNSQHQQ